MTTFPSILVLVTAVLAVFWQAAFSGIRNIIGAQIDLLPALIVFASLRTSLATVAALALLGGLLFDSLSANPLGVSVLPLFVVGLLINSQRELILRDQPFAQFVLGLIASAVTPVLTVLLLLTQGLPLVLGLGSLWQWFVMSLGGAIATPILFQLFALCERTLSYRRSVETSFRPDREIRRGR